LGGPCARAAQPADAKPLLQRSEDTETALRAYGFEEVRVFTWRHGLLEGKVTFLDGQTSKPIALSAVVLGTTKELLRKGESLERPALKCQEWITGPGRTSRPKGVRNLPSTSSSCPPNLPERIRKRRASDSKARTSCYCGQLGATTARQA